MSHDGRLEYHQLSALGLAKRPMSHGDLGNAPMNHDDNLVFAFCLYIALF
jgi:hypothetical protein